MKVNQKITGEDFRKAEPFPHFVIDNFLEESFARSLFDTFPKFADENAIAEHGRVGGKAVREDVRNLAPPYLELDRYFSSKEFLDWMSSVTGIPDLLYDPDYTGGGTHENRTGQDLSIHIDFNYHPKSGLHRRLNALLYLNPEWEESWGGALELWRDPWTAPSKNKIAKIAPLWNRLAVFPTTETSWHGFETVRAPAGVSRKSFALYLYTKERPASDTGAMHSTVYFERPMPETIRAGAVMSKADFDEMERLTVRRDELLKFLYHREKQFSTLVADQNKGLRYYEEVVRRQRDWRASLAQLPEATPLILSPSQTCTHWVAAGFWPKPVLGRFSRVVVDKKKTPELGDWVLMKLRDLSELQLVQLADRAGDLYLATQPAKPRVLLLHPQDLYGVVVAVYNELDDKTELPAKQELPASSVFLVHVFLALHRLKDAIFGRLRSPLLWKVSGIYRGLLAKLGIQAPVLPPSRR